LSYARSEDLADGIEPSSPTRQAPENRTPSLWFQTKYATITLVPVSADIERLSHRSRIIFSWPVSHLTFVGMARFELATSCVQDRQATTAPHPDRIPLCNWWGASRGSLTRCSSCYSNSRASDLFCQVEAQSRVFGYSKPRLGDPVRVDTQKCSCSYLTI
jgi:hypothetical protein